MVQETKKRSFLGGLEEKLGIPPLSQVVGLMEKFPDAKQMRLIKEILVAAEAVSHNAPDLDKVVALIREINSMPIERLEKLEKVLKRIDKIIKNAPDQLVEFLTSLK
jgi:hypothetical protein